MEHEIVRSVAAAQKDAQAADALVRQYLPFIKAETAKFLKRIPVEGKDDEFGIAMFAFHEAAMAYQSGRGTFLKLAAAATATADRTESAEWSSATPGKSRWIRR